VNPDVAEVGTYDGADPAPVGVTGWEASAGLALVAIHVPDLPVFPALTGGVAAERGLSDAVDLGVRYTTWLGYDHRIGPTTGVRVVDVGPWALGARAHPWVRVAGTAQHGVDLGGDVSTQTALALTRATSRFAWTVDAGTTVQWVLFERLDGVGFVDGKPWLATVDVAAEVAWPDRWAEALAVRLEVGIPRAPDDPIAVLGVRPRLVFAGNFRSRTGRPPRGGTASTSSTPRGT
jgi:hypothetical protein